MAAIKVETFGDIVDDVLRRARQPDKSTASISIVESIKGYINLRYQLVSARKKWRWRREERRLEIKAKVTSGTVSIANGSRTVSFSGAIDETYLNRKIIINNFEEHYRIVAVHVADQEVELDERFRGTGGEGLSYVLYKDEYGLFPDLEEIEYIKNPYRRCMIQPSSSDDIQDMRNRWPLREGKIQAYTIDGPNIFYSGPPMGEFLMGYDFMGGDDLKVKRLSIFPSIADADYTIPILYQVKITPLDAYDDEPLMPLEDRQVLVFGALADFFEEIKDDQAFTLWQSYYEATLQEMESDYQDTDGTSQLYVRDIWRRDRTYHSQRNYSGDIFDYEDY